MLGSTEDLKTWISAVSSKPHQPERQEYFKGDPDRLKSDSSQLPDSIDRTRLILREREKIHVRNGKVDDDGTCEKREKRWNEQDFVRVKKDELFQFILISSP